MAAVAERTVQRTTARIAIVKPPRGWTPTSDTEAPPRGRLVKVLNEPMTDAETFVRQFNAASRDEGARLWAVIRAG